MTLQKAFTIVALPDTQYYAYKRLSRTATFPGYPNHYYAQTQWIADNKESLNIQFVVHLGDITMNNLSKEWVIARKAMDTLKDAGIPFSISTGDHDCRPTPNDTLLNRYFTVDYARRYCGLLDALDTRLENAAYVIPNAGTKIIVVALQWAPTTKVVRWARRILNGHWKKDYYNVLLTTHTYMFLKNARHNQHSPGQYWNPHTYGNLPADVHDGEELWNKLVKDFPNVFLTLNGHIGDPSETSCCHAALGRRFDKNSFGNRVNQVLVNYQNFSITGKYEDYEWGHGFLRLMHFLPDGETVWMRSYSPSARQYLADDANDFVIKLRPKLEPDV